MRGRQQRRRTAGLAALAASLLLATGAAAQYDGHGYDPTQPGGYEPGGGYGPGGGSGAGKVKFTLEAKKKQRSLKAVKVKATCENRPCNVVAKGKLRAGGDKAKLKRDEETLAAGVTDKLKLKLPKRARRTAKSALRDGEKLTVKVRGKANGVGGGGRDKDAVKVKLKP